MRLVTLVTGVFITCASLPVQLIAQETVPKKVIVGTMINEQSREKAIEFQRADCERGESGAEMTCDFHVALVVTVGRDTCAVLATGYRRVLRHHGDGEWESNPGPPEDVCGTSDVLTLSSSTGAAGWTMSRKRTAPTRDANSSFCRTLPKEERFTEFGRKKVPGCRLLRPAGQ